MIYVIDEDVALFQH